MCLVCLVAAAAEIVALVSAWRAGESVPSAGPSGAG
jgi:hypothetical protein